MGLLRHYLVRFLLVTLLLVGLPFLGLILSGKPLAPYLEFPPHSYYIDHAPFSWSIFIFATLLASVLVGGLVYLALSLPLLDPSTPKKRGVSSFPWWGWVAGATLCLSWVMAWTRFSWFSQFQTLTFIPLWLSFIVLVNALTFRRTGHCLLLNQPRYFLSLFCWSAVFWWYFEYLNRFVQSWRYIGISDFNPIAYVVHSSLAFSTVLPAVLSVHEWLQSFFKFDLSRDCRPWSLTSRDTFAWFSLFLASCGLLGIAIWPNYLFPLLWVSPLVILVAIQVLTGQRTVFQEVGYGHCHILYLPALAALLCGVFWEMWNYYSEAKWVYSIPFVHRFQIFEMPILGYSGYLPFGLQCVVAADYVSRLSSRE